MKSLSIKKYRINTKNVRTNLSHILSQTRRRTSKVVKFWKHMGQILRERIPVVSPLQELIAGKSLISEIHVIKYSMSRWGRVVIAITEGIFAGMLIFYGDHIIEEARNNLSNIIFYLKFPHYISMYTAILMIVMCIGTIGYYGMIKPGDFKQAIKEHKEENR